MNTEILKKIGFSQKEVTIYLALLEFGQAKAQELADKTDISRPSVYDVLGGLVKKGLVSKGKKGKTTYFYALDPERLLGYIDREIDTYTKRLAAEKKNVERLLPELLSLQHTDSTKPKVQIFEGEKGVRTAYEDTLTAKDGILAYANVQTMHDGLPNFFPEYYKRRAEAGAYIRAILPRNEASQERALHDRSEMRTTRFFEEGDEFSPEVNIYNDKVLIASWKEKMAVLIESKEYADFQRLLFEKVWEQAARK